MQTGIGQESPLLFVSTMAGNQAGSYKLGNPRRHAGRLRRPYGLGWLPNARGLIPRVAHRGDGAPREVEMVGLVVGSFILGMICGALLLAVLAVCVASGDEAQRRENAGLERRS